MIRKSGIRLSVTRIHPKLGQFLKHLETYRVFYFLAAAISINIFSAFSGYTLEHLKLYSHLSFFLFGMFIILSFPLRLVPGIFIGCAALSVILFWINEEKGSLTMMPLTYLDFKITISHPSGLVNAVKAPGWIVHSLIALAAATVLIAVWVAAKSIRNLLVQPDYLVSRRFLLHALAFILLLGSTGVFIKQYTRIVRTYVQTNDVWNNLDLYYLSRALSVWGFLVYSIYLEQTESGDLYNSDKGTAGPTREEIMEAVKKYVNLEDNKTHMKPNIVVVLAESMFNPSDFFRLAKPIENKLFEPNKYTQSLGQLYVNAIGGGTWITEFEFITGMDSRLFGYSGYYTHASISPYINRSFATYLKDRGYVTEVCYAVEASFYNAANAYKNYGIDSFTPDTAGASWNTRDDQLIGAVIESSKQQDKPFMKFIVTIENHSPHECKNFSSKEQFLTAFDGLPGFNNANCVLNEFTRNMQSTERAFLSLIEYLEEQEKLTGRPFVLLIYGDHQPHTFSEFSMPLDYEDIAKYDKFRKDLSERKTFFHIASSIPGVLNCCDKEPPHITVMPTLLSAYVASDYDDLYLDVNLYSYDKCGSDLMGKGISSGAYGLDSAHTVETGTCPVYENLLTAYRNSGIVSNMR